MNIIVHIEPLNDTKPNCPYVHFVKTKENGWTELEGYKVINKCDQSSEWLVGWTISGFINFTDGVREYQYQNEV